MMKYIIFVLVALFSIPVFAQDEILLKTDGTKYYIQVFDGITNDRVLYHNNEHPDWQTKIQVADFFDGSDNQLWSFEATEMFPGYFSIVNHDEDITLVHHLMSWNWNAYFADNRDPLSDMEMQYKVREVTDGYFVLETFEKPAGLYGIEYTDGADALNVKSADFVSFSDVKSADVTADNMVNKVFKFIEFNPIALFTDAIDRGQQMYEVNTDLSDASRLALFTVLEEARSIRVFGTEAEMLAFQPILDEALNTFNLLITLKTFVEDSRSYIDTMDVDDGVKNSFNFLVDEAEELLGSNEITSEEIQAIIDKIEAAKRLIAAMIAAETYAESISGNDEEFASGVYTSIDGAKAVLADPDSEIADYDLRILHLMRTREVVEEIMDAQAIIAATQEFEEEKATLAAVLTLALQAINSDEVTVEQLDQSIIDIRAAVSAFQRSLEAGDVPVMISNGDFEEGLEFWNVDSPTPGSAYPEMKGVDGSQSITTWSGSDYEMKVFQSISDIPNGIYTISCHAQVNSDNMIGLFAESDTDTTLLPFTNQGGLNLYQVEVEVSDGTLQYGIRGVGENNGIPGNNWIVFDNFELKWSTKTPIANSGFEQDFEGWFTESNVEGRPYIENKGVDGSKSVTFWHSSDYEINMSQTIQGLEDGHYSLSVMTNASADSSFVLYASSGDTTFTTPISQGGLTKHQLEVQVSNSEITIGLRGVGENGLALAGHWVVIDDIKLLRQGQILIVNSDFENDFEGWTKASSVEWMPYIENKGIDGSKSVTFWQGEDYWAYAFQSLENMANGVYEISAMTNTPIDSAFQIFGSNGENEYSEPIRLSSGLEKSSVEARVFEGLLDFGISGAGVEDSVGAGEWIVFDNFQVVIKAITPVNEEVVFSPFIDPDITHVDEDEEEITVRQDSETIHIQSTKKITKYAVYNVSGALIEQQSYDERYLSIRLNHGVFFVQIQTESGHVEVKKLIVL